MGLPAYFAGFENSPQERQPLLLHPSAPLPSWLRGVLLRTGPALFELGPDHLAHWFDGLAKLHRLAFSPDGVTYSSAFLRSRAFAGYQRQRRLASHEFASRPALSTWRRLGELLLGPTLTDNGNVNVLPLPDGTWLTLTETTRTLQLADDLQSARHFSFRDRWQGQVSTAHPLIDPTSGEVINLVLQLGARSHYLFTSWDRVGHRRRLLARLPVRRPAYQHSFALTPQHLVLIESPLRVNPLRLRFGSQPFIDNYRWHGADPTWITLISRSSGEVVRRHAIPACFHFHVVNAWEDAEQIWLDLPLYADAAVVDSLRLGALRSGQTIASSRLVRLRLPLGPREAELIELVPHTLELPRLHPAWMGQHHPVAYLSESRCGQMLDGVVRWSERDGITHRWSSPDVFPGEPLFVPRPQPRGVQPAADDGVLLVMLLDGVRQTSALLVLDGADLAELARVELPDCVPFSFHGQFRPASPHLS